MRAHSAWKVPSVTAPGELRADAAGEPLAHLAGRLVGERDRQDLAGVGDALLDQVRGALGHHARLAGAGAGDHEQRAVGVKYGFTLLRVQARRGAAQAAAASGSGSA